MRIIRLKYFVTLCLVMSTGCTSYIYPINRFNVVDEMSDGIPDRYTRQGVQNVALNFVPTKDLPENVRRSQRISIYPISQFNLNVKETSNPVKKAILHIELLANNSIDPAHREFKVSIYRSSGKKELIEVNVKDTIVVAMMEFTVPEQQLYEIDITDVINSYISMNYEYLGVKVDAIGHVPASKADAYAISIK